MCSSDLIIRACLHARLAGDTPLSVEIDNTVIPIIKRAGRTYFYAGCFLTMVAAQNRKEALSVRERPLFYILYPGPVHTNGHLMFGLAGYRTGVAANTFPVIDEEPEVHLSNSKTEFSICFASFFSLETCRRVKSGNPAGIRNRGAGVKIRQIGRAHV